MADDCIRKVQIWDGKVLIDSESGGVAVSETCCCGDVPPGQPGSRCPCNCVCPFAWEFRQLPADNSPERGYFFTEELLIPTAPWTLAFWTKEQARNPPDCDTVPAIRVGFAIDIRRTDEAQDDRYFQCWTNATPDQVTVAPAYFDAAGNRGGEVPVTMPIDDGFLGCHFIALTVDNLVSPDEMEVNAYLDGQPDIGNPHLGPANELWQPNPANAIKMWVGRGSLNYTLNPAYPRCMDNLTIWHRKLSDAEILAQWNAGAGTIDTNATYQWCPTQNWQQAQVDSIGGKVLQFVPGTEQLQFASLSTGVERDGFLDCIQDQYAKNVIGVYQAV